MKPQVLIEKHHILQLLVFIQALCILLLALIILNSTSYKTIKEKQKEMIDRIASAYQVKPIKINERKFEIKNIEIINEPTSQRIAFDDYLLFGSGSSNLDSKGKETLSKVGEALRTQLVDIKEIQIEGYTDNVETPTSNLNLGFSRAKEVFLYFKSGLRIDPNINLMSACTFGEYKPTHREENSCYCLEQLKIDNSTEYMKSKNRRVELHLFFYY